MEDNKSLKRKKESVKVLCSKCKAEIEEAACVSRTKAYQAQKQKEYRARKKQKLMKEKAEQEMLDTFVDNVLAGDFTIEDLFKDVTAPGALFSE